MTETCSVPGGTTASHSIWRSLAYGVMLFFVLSGLLTGTIMLDLLERGASPKDWGIFPVRRWLRILPAYYFRLFALLIPLAYFGPYGVPWDEARHALPWLWSLCVEEWFYITFPALILTILTTIGGAIHSWRVVERPCLKLRPGQFLP